MVWGRNRRKPRVSLAENRRRLEDIENQIKEVSTLPNSAVLLEELHSDRNKLLDRIARRSR